MADKRPALVKGTTPKGIAVWPHLNTPDDYKGKKSFKTGLILEADAAQPLIDQINAETEKVLAETKAKLEDQIKNGKTGDAKAKAKKALSSLEVSYPYSAAVDDNGDETGDYRFNFKANAEFEDKKTKAIKKITIPLFDAKGQPTKVLIWGGSTIRVAYALVPYYVASANACGVSLRINGIKVINLVSSGGGNSASSLGFGEEEDGYDATDMEGDESNGVDTSGSNDSTDEDEDF